MPAQKIQFKFGELFCGPGGLSLGALRSKVAGPNGEFSVAHAWSSDYHHDTCVTYANNLCGGVLDHVYCEDVRRLDIESLEPVDAFAYGFPCNDFSLIGEQKGFNGTFGPLYSYGLRVLNAFKPKFFVAENVSGLSSANEGEAFTKILSDLQKAGNGYNITAHLYHAEDYGIPQTRHRIVIVGIDSILGLKFTVPTPTTAGNPVSAKTALESPPIDIKAPNHDLTKQSAIVVERLRHIRPGENVWNANLPDHLKLNVKGAKLSQIYKRLHPDKPSYTITGSGGGGTHGYHWSEPRALTNRERARIQTFPDDFIFHGSKESVRKQIGMAVPPLLAETIFKAVLNTFAGIRYPAIEANISI